MPSSSKSREGASKISHEEVVKANAKQLRKLDPALASLFENSLGPVQPAAKPRNVSSRSEQRNGERHSSPNFPTAATNIENDLKSKTSAEEAQQAALNPQVGATLPRSVRKRKRDEDDVDVEATYLDQLVREEIKEEKRRSQVEHKKRPKIQGSEPSLAGTTSSVPDDGFEKGTISNVTSNDEEDSGSDLPQHESMIASKEDLDFEKSSRTVFLANVSTLAIKSKNAKKQLLDHLVSFTPSSDGKTSKPAVESLRFRSTAFASSGLPKKAAFAKRELMDTTTKSTNAYAVYATKSEARQAAKKLNGSIILDRHLRVDSVAHPAKIDHRRCVFVGNLGFVDDATNINAAEDEDNNKRLRKAKEPADVEEGLWRQFSKAGLVESVRVVRDKTTRVGKGFAYVQFEDANFVEKALLYNEKKFPPMLPRILRVTRAKNIKKVAGKKEKRLPFKTRAESTARYNPKVPAQVQSLSGRAGKLLGRAGAAQVKAAGEKQKPASKLTGVSKSPETIVFEGYRASRQQGKGALRIGGSGKAQNKPGSRSSRRGADFKAKGRQKART